MVEIKKYDTVFRDEQYRSRQASQGLHYVAKLCTDYTFKTVLDMGCGPGWSVLEFLIRGKKAQGVEPCKYLFTQELRVPAGLGIVKEGLITSIPFPAGSFNMTFCTDVLEHISEKDVGLAISELVRVSEKYIFCSICSGEAVLFPELKLHLTVKSRIWWEEQFNKFKLKKVEVEGMGNLVYMYRRMS